MKEDLQNIDMFYIDALSNFEGETSRRFKINIYLLFLFLRIRKLILGFIILTGFVITGYFGYGLLNDINENNTSQNFETKDEVKSNHEKSKIKNNSLPIVEIQDHKSTSTYKLEDAIEEKEKPLSSTYTKKPKSLFVTTTVASFDKETVPILVLETKQVTTLIDDFLMEKIVHRKTEFITTDSNTVEDSKEQPLSMVQENSQIKSNWFSLSLYASPGISQVKLKADNGFDDYLELRRDNESHAFSWSAGGDVQFHLKNWFVQTGLNYTVYKNNKNYNYNYQVLDSANSYFDYDTIWVWIYDPPNLEYPVMVGIDTVWVPVYENINVKNSVINEWSYLEIPVLIGYKFNYHKFGFEIATGISMGFLLESKGNLPRLPDAEGMEDLDNLSGEINKTMFSYLLQAGVSYQMAGDWSVIIQPYYKQNLQSVFENNYPIDQKFRAFGFNIGVRVKL